MFNDWDLVIFILFIEIDINLLDLLLLKLYNFRCPITLCFYFLHMLPHVLPKLPIFFLTESLH